jgi:hypothetical protein
MPSAVCVLLLVMLKSKVTVKSVHKDGPYHACPCESEAARVSCRPFVPVTVSETYRASFKRVHASAPS